MFENVYKNFLCKVLCLFPVAQESIGQIENFLLIGQNDPFEGFRVSVLGQLDPSTLPIAQVWRGLRSFALRPFLS
jgi:hypothetical protein